MESIHAAKMHLGAIAKITVKNPRVLDLPIPHYLMNVITYERGMAQLDWEAK